MDFDKVRSYYQPAGWEPHEVVAKSDFDACHVALKEIRRALENHMDTRFGLSKEERVEFANMAVDVARTELAQEAKEVKA